MALVELRIQLLQASEHLQGGSQGSLGIVLPDQRNPEHGHDGIADVLLDRAAPGLDDGRHGGEIRAQQDAKALGAELFPKSGRSRDVREQDRHELALLAGGLEGGERRAAVRAEAEPFGTLGPAIHASQHGRSLRRCTRALEGASCICKDRAVASDIETGDISECFDRCACAKAGRSRPGSIRGVSRLLVELLEKRGLYGRTVLELGCGLGGLSLDVVTRGATMATGVDLSPVAIREASRLAVEAGLAERLDFLVGDGARIDLPPRDVIVLDKVICCYPEADVLIQNSVRAANSTYAFVLPFSSGWQGILARFAIRVENGIRRVRGQPFRAYVHDVGRIEGRIAKAGLERVAWARRLIWYVAVHERLSQESHPAAAVAHARGGRELGGRLRHETEGLGPTEAAGTARARTG